jgi:hypothetical protein
MVIAYVGFERCDIPYYIAKAAIALNQKTLVIDNSVTGDLFRSLTDATDRFREFDMFTIIRGLNVTEDDIEGFENTIIYHGLSRYNEQYQIKPDCVYVSTTMAKHVILDTACALENAGLKDTKKAILVVEDEVQRKYSLQEIANEIGIVPVNGYVIPLNEVDHNKYEMLCANGAVSLKNCSQDMKEVIFEAIVELSGVANPKQVNKFISRL